MRNKGEMGLLEIVKVFVVLLAWLTLFLIAPMALMVVAYNRLAYPWDYTACVIILIIDFIGASRFSIFNTKGGRS